MIILEEKEIFNSIAKHIISSEIDDKWTYAILKIMVIGNTVDFNLNFSYNNSILKNTKIKNAFSCSMDILKLHRLTNNHPNYKKWNKSEFILYANSTCKIEYFFDEVLQNEIDRLNKKTT